MQERFELALSRIAQMKEENTVKEYQPFFSGVAEFICECAEQLQWLEDDGLAKADLQELQAQNESLYRDILKENYDASYANPAYAVKSLGDDLGVLCSVLYTEIRSIVPFVYERNIEEITIRLELFLEVYSMFDCKINEDGVMPSAEELKDLLCEVLRENKVLVERVIPYAKAGVIQQIRKSGELLEEKYQEDGIYVKAYVPMEVYGRL